MHLLSTVVVCVICCYIPLSRTEDPTTDSSKTEGILEDQRIVNETLTKYGPVVEAKQFGLPGPELLTDKKKELLANQFTGEVGNYTLKIRTIFESFSYNSRYEEGFLKIIDGEQTPVIKGQFGEHFERKTGGYYIRTVGYVLDEDGYRQFLIDLNKATRNIRTRISSTAIASLVGGGLG